MSPIKDAQVRTTDLDKKTTYDAAPKYEETDVDVSVDFSYHDPYDGLVKPTDEELQTLRKVAGKMPHTTYWMCAVEFAERASYYGTSQVYSNFIRAPLPAGGNGAGATPRGSNLTAGALGKGTVTTTAMTQAFSFMAYAFPIFFGWLADAKYGRFKLVCWGVAVCGFAHILMIFSSIPEMLATGQAIIPFAISLYTLAIGAAMFKPNITPMIMDQSPHKIPNIIIDEKTGERVIVDPEASLNSIMLWFYMLINVGAMLGVATSYLAKDVGFWSAYLVPTILYLLLPPLLFFLNKRLIKQPPGGSDLGKVCAVIADAFRNGAVRRIGRKGFWDIAMPSRRRAEGSTRTYDYDDSFVNDVRRTFQACAIFLFIPIFNINDGGLGASGNALTASMTTGGTPNDVLNNLNSISIVCAVPLMNHVIYPFLRSRGITWGPISRMTFGFLLASVGSVPYAVLQYFVYQTSPCGYSATTCSDIITDGSSTVSPISLGWFALPTILTAIAEIFVNVTAYSVAYSRSPKNMKGLVSAINLFMTAISSAIGLATADAIQDPYLVWVFAGPSIAGFVLAIVFYFTFRHIDKETFVLNTDPLLAGMTRSEERGESKESGSERRTIGKGEVRRPRLVGRETGLGAVIVAVPEKA